MSKLSKILDRANRQWQCGYRLVSLYLQIKGPEMREIFRVGDEVVLKKDGGIELAAADVLAALAKGPLRIVAVISSPLAECNCRGVPHGAICAVKGLPWGRVGHPQWLILSDIDGAIFYGPPPSIAARRFSGAWFTVCQRQHHFVYVDYS